MKSLNRYIHKSPSPKGTLFIVTHYDWMKPYVQAALKDLWDEDSLLVVVVTNDAERREFEWLPQNRVSFIPFPKGWLRQKLFMLYSGSVKRAVMRFVRLHHPRVVLSLSTDHSTWLWLPRLQRSVPTIYTAHNIHPHRYTHPTLRSRIFFNLFYAIPLKRLVRSMRNKVVNAEWQKKWVEDNLPGHRVGYLGFPSLITSQIAHGRDIPPEIHGHSGYILFFGLVEHYKGVEKLIEMYADTPQLHSRRLVIAGKGNLGRNVPPDISDRVIRIPRYLPDSEVGELMRRADVVVYPYLAATQSGVLSVASYFGRPMVLSNVDYFRDTAQGFPGVEIVDVHNRQAFAQGVMKVLERAESTRPLYEARYVNVHWREDFNNLVDKFFYSASDA